MKIDIHQAKSKLDKIADLVQKGETVVITRAGEACLDMVPHRRTRGRRKPGRLKGRIAIAPHFDPTPIDILRDFEHS